MRGTRAFLILLCVGAGSQALAADPPAPIQVQPGQPAPAAAVTPPTTAATTDSTANSAKADASPKSDVTEAQAKSLRSAGYRPEVRKGQTLYCRREAQIGTRFESKVCGTFEEIERSIQNSQELATRIQQKAYVKANGNP